MGVGVGVHCQDTTVTHAHTARYTCTISPATPALIAQTPIKHVTGRYKPTHQHVHRHALCVSVETCTQQLEGT